MNRQSFNDKWTVHQINTRQSAYPITLPHDAMISEPRTGDALGGVNVGWFEGHDYEYEKIFFVPKDWHEKKIYIYFEGVYRKAEVYLNQEKLWFQPNGYLPFDIELTEYLKYGEENQLKVIAHNSDQPNSRWYSGAGIYRPVWLTKKNKKCILPRGIKICTVSHDPAIIKVMIKTSNSGMLNIKIKDDGMVLAEAVQKTSGEATIIFNLENVTAWSVDTPKLYKCQVQFEQDTEEINFGIRKLEWDSENGFCLNGERIILRGACVHHDNGLLGACAYSYAEERKIRILQECGFNAIRSAHNACSEAMLDVCDRLGMLVIDEYTDMWYMHKTKYDYAEYFGEWWQKDLTTLVDRDYNHPSVIMYSIGNEVGETAQERGINLCEEMVQFLHQQDSRPVTCGINIFFNLLSSLGMGVYSDEKAEKTNKSKKTKKVGSEFYNNLAGIMGADFMKFGATLHGSDMKTKDAYSKMDMAGYNYGILRYKMDLKKYPNRMILGSETFCSDMYLFWELAKKHPTIVGDFVWAGMDYLGEVGIGAWEYKDYAPDFSHGPGWIAAGSGIVDLTGKMEGQAAYTQVVYEKSDIRIAVKPVNHTKDRHSPSAWRMTNAIESWSWDECEGKDAQIEVYTKGKRIELWLNGKKMAAKKCSKTYRTIFRIKYQPGELTAISFDQQGKEICRTHLKSAEDTTEVRILPEQSVCKANGLCYIRLQYTDQNGIVKPLKRGKIRVLVSGGTLLGLGNGCPFSEQGYLTTETDTYYGEALAIVKPDMGDAIIFRASSVIGEAEISIPIVHEEG